MNCTVWECNKCGHQNFIVEYRCKNCGITYKESSDIYKEKINKGKYT